MNEIKSKIPFDHIVITSPDQKAAEAALCGPLTNISCPNSTITSTCDPMNTRMGSGGGTIAALDHVSSSSNEEEETVLIIHAGGESSRCPTQMSLGKAWTTIPCASDEMENPTSLLISTLSHLLQNIPTGSVIVAASDVLLSFHNSDDTNNLNESEPIDFDTFKDKNIVLGVTVPAPISTATNHGVFVFNKNDDYDDNSAKSKIRPISHFLQKPSIEEMKKHSENDNAWVDTGVVIFLPKAAKMLRSMAQNQLNMCTQKGLEHMFQVQHGKQLQNETCYEMHAFAKKSTLRIELYSHFMLALSTDGDKHHMEDFSKRRTAYINDHLSINKNEPNAGLLECIHDNFSKFELQACTVPNGKFIHLGTSLELMEFMIDGTTKNITNESQGSHPNTKCLEFGQRIGLTKRSKTLLNFLKCSDSSVVCNTIITNEKSQKNGKNYDSYHSIGDMTVLEHCALLVQLPPDHHNLKLKSDVPQSDNHHYRLKIGSNCLISGIRGLVNETVTIPSNMCLQMIPLKTDWQRLKNPSNDLNTSTNQNSYYVYMYLSVLDDIKKCATIYDIPFSEFLKYGQISIEDIWDTSSIDESQRTLWNAKLHSVVTLSNDSNNNNFDKIDFQWDHLEWVELLKARVASADPTKTKREQKSFQKWMSLPRLSLSEIRSAADALKEFQYRDNISNNWFPFHQRLTSARLILEQRRHVSFSNELFNYCTSQNIAVSPNYIHKNNLLSVFRAFEDIVCMNIYGRKYDISSRVFMVLAGLFYDLNKQITKPAGLIDDVTVLSNSQEQVKETFDTIQFLSNDDISRAIACVNLFSVWEKELFHHNTSNPCNFSIMLRTCMNQMELVASALTDLCCRSCSIDERIPFDKWVIASAPARIDLSGGWSDTPPISYEFGGVISVAQRAEYIARIRDLTKEIGKIWVESQS